MKRQMEDERKKLARITTPLVLAWDLQAMDLIEQAVVENEELDDNAPIGETSAHLKMKYCLHKCSRKGTMYGRCVVDDGMECINGMPRDRRGKIGWQPVEVTYAKDG